MKASRPTPISCHTGPTLCSTCSIENVSCPAGTGVWVVNVLAARTLRTASANGVPRVTSSRTRSTSMNAACPSFACQAAGSYPRARNTRTPPTRSEEHTSELQSLRHLVCRLLLEKNIKYNQLKHELRILQLPA